MIRPPAVTRVLDLMRRRPLLSYYVLVVAISWGGGLIVLGGDVFVGLKPMARAQMPLALVFAWAGTTAAGLSSVALVAGQAGLRDLRARWTKWRVGRGWYAMALFTAPVVTIAILLTLALVSGSGDFLPLVVTTSDKIGVLVPAILAAAINPFFEEMGWTGFAVPRFLKRYGIMRAGLIAGLLWGAWHYPMFAGDAFSGAPIAPAAYLALLLFGWLPPYRVLMVWAYDRTQSVLVAWLMHAAIDFNVLAILPASNKEVAIPFTLLYGAALWIVAFAVTAGDRARSRQPVGAGLAS